MGKRLARPVRLINRPAMIGPTPTVWVRVLPVASRSWAMARALALSWVSRERISVTRSLATALRACSTAPLGRTVRSRAAAVVADRSRGAPPAMRARSRAWSWLTARTLDWGQIDPSLIEYGDGV